MQWQVHKRHQLLRHPTERSQQNVLAQPGVRKRPRYRSRLVLCTKRRWLQLEPALGLRLVGLVTRGDTD